MRQPLRQLHIHISKSGRCLTKVPSHSILPRARWQSSGSSSSGSTRCFALNGARIDVVARRQLSSSRLVRANDEPKKGSDASTTPSSTPQATEQKRPSSADSTSTLTEAQERNPSQTLPSKASVTDAIVARATQLSHVLNSYTGTDYTPITQLREAIQAQESLAGARQAALAAAQTAYDTARDQQAASHSELIQLLERKSSWGNGDLERYMALVRSEHLDEQGVDKAREALREAERGLEEARAELERMERRRYHEEQVWSDTIRRNSTWVTCGLMGVNILVLIVGLVVVEPWRRRRLVNEVGELLDERETIALSGDVGRAVDMAVEADPDVRTVDAKANQNADVDVLSVDASGVVIIPGEAVQGQHDATPSSKSPSHQYFGDSWAGTLDMYRKHWRYMFSDQPVTLRRVDLTTTALEGIAAGAAFMGLLFVMLRPR